MTHLLPCPHLSRTVQMLRQPKCLGWGRGLCTPAGSPLPYLLACTSMRTATQVTPTPLLLTQLRYCWLLFTHKHAACFAHLQVVAALTTSRLCTTCLKSVPSLLNIHTSASMSHYKIVAREGSVSVAVWRNESLVTAQHREGQSTG